MKRHIGIVMTVLIASLFFSLMAYGANDACAPDSVRSGTSCIDRYEASVWMTTDTGIIQKIRNGTANLADLQAVGAVQLGLADGDLSANGCPTTGNGCTNIYAVSVPNVKPAAYITWFQAAAAARNAHKRLPSNQEWQVAALGTPDGSPCIVAAAEAGNTGTPGCVSDVGAFDMVGNIDEWVADWVPASTACPGWSGFSDDFMCLAGASEAFGPGALVRGGSFGHNSQAGVFAVQGGAFFPSDAVSDIGFRAAR